MRYTNEPMVKDEFFVLNTIDNKLDLKKGYFVQLVDTYGFNLCLSKEGSEWKVYEHKSGLPVGKQGFERLTNRKLAINNALARMAKQESIKKGAIEEAIKRGHEKRVKILNESIELPF